MSDVSNKDKQTMDHAIRQSYLVSIKQSLARYKKHTAIKLMLGLAIALLALFPSHIISHQGIESFDYLSLWHIHQSLALGIFLLDIAALFLFCILLRFIHGNITSEGKGLQAHVIPAIKRFPLVLIDCALYGGILFCSTLPNYFLSRWLHKQGEATINLYFFHLHTLAVGIIPIYIFFVMSYFLVLNVCYRTWPVLSILQSCRITWGNWWYTFFMLATPWFVLNLFYRAAVFIISNTNPDWLNIQYHQIPLIDSGLSILLYMLILPWSAATLVIGAENLKQTHGIA
jgi:hypothetical protein